MPGPTGPEGPTGPTGAASLIPGPTGSTGPTGPRGGVTYYVSSTGDGGSFFVAGLDGTNPTLTVVRGEKVYFDVSNVQVTNSLALRLASGSTSTVPGTTNNSTVSGRNLASADTVIVYDVPLDAPIQIIYQDVTDPTIGGVIDIVDKIGPTGPTGSEGPAGVPTVNAYSPVWSATGFTYTGNPTNGLYSRYGQAVTFQIELDFTNVTSVGTGGYTTTLPFLPEAGFNLTFSGYVSDSVGTDFKIVAVSTAASATLTLYYLTTNGELAELTGAAPSTLNTFSRIYINGTYIAEAQ